VPVVTGDLQLPYAWQAVNSRGIGCRRATKAAMTVRSQVYPNRFL
jgi:hypothetical protein